MVSRKVPSENNPLRALDESMPGFLGTTRGGCRLKLLDRLRSVILKKAPSGQRAFSLLLCGRRRLLKNLRIHRRVHLNFRILHRARSLPSLLVLAMQRQIQALHILPL